MRRWQSGQLQLTVNQSPSGYVGSNPTRRTMNQKDIHEIAKKLFMNHRNMIHECTRDQAVTIEHVGASSIPGALTKGDLDIEVKTNRENFKRIKDSLQKKYIVKHPEIWTDNFAIFKSEDILPVDILLVVAGTPYDTFTKTRDILQNTPILLKEYNQLKQKYQNETYEIYSSVKKEFYRKILKGRNIVGYN